MSSLYKRIICWLLIFLTPLGIFASMGVPVSAGSQHAVSSTLAEGYNAAIIDAIPPDSISSVPPNSIASALPAPVTIALTQTFDGTQSVWAEPFLQKGNDYGLTYPDIMKNFKKPITREEFCTIVVKLYEKLTGAFVNAVASPFTDTSNSEIIKAFQLGIVNGTGGGKFSPYNNITRQEICVMIFRCLGVALPQLNKDTSGDFPFSDQDLIASWALTAMKFAYKNTIMNGVGNNKIDPLSNTTREQAITLLVRTYEAFKKNEINGTVNVGQPAIVPSEKDKFKALDFYDRISMPGFDTRIKLYAATEAGKPVSKPTADVSDKLIVASAGNISDIPYGLNFSAVINFNIMQSINGIPASWKLPRPKGPVYSDAPCASFIDRNGSSKILWFYFKLQNANAAKIVWQVSKTPFTGLKDSWKNPVGLVKSGDVSPAQTEFSVDFAAFAPGVPLGGIYKLNIQGLLTLNNTGTYKEIPKGQRKYFVRAVPVDVQGNCIGDPGTGVSVLYGDPATSPAMSLTPVTSSFQLWGTLRQNDPEGGGPYDHGSSGEFPNKLVHQTQPYGYSCESTEPLWFCFYGYDPSATRIVIQVSTKPFTGTAADWQSFSGLAYTKTYSTLPAVVYSGYKDTVPISFTDFGPSKSIMKPDEYIPYYVRAVAVKPSNTPGSNDVTFSETITVKYGYPSMPKIYIPQTIVAKSYLPAVQLIHYQPVQWESDWEHHYYVFRKPKWNEINCMFRNVNTGAVLHSYAYYMMTDPGLTIDKYENEIIPTVLVPGTKVTIIDKVEDKSWWQDLWDSIVNFFSSILDVIKSIVNWVSSAYADLKVGLINFVASNFPGIPDDWRAGLQKALTALVDTGLAAMGIPPDLPNFDQLTSMSVDYMAQVALTESGIPANDITQEMIDKTASGISDQMKDSADKATPNPIDAAFLKVDPQWLYAPAYMDIQVSNPYDKPSLPISLNIDALWEWRDSNITITHDVWGQLPTDQQYADSLQYVSHFLYGLSRGHNGYPIYYPVFEPVRGQPVPSLKPGEKSTVRIYLKEYYGKPYPFAVNGDIVTPEDFFHLYWGELGDVSFRVYTDGYDLPDAKQAAISQGFVGDSDHIYYYTYDTYQNSAGFTGDTSAVH